MAIAGFNDFDPEKIGSITGAQQDIDDLWMRGVFADAVRATRMPMAVTDATKPGNPIIYANEAMLDVTGYRLEEVLGQQPHFMNGEDTDPEHARRFREAFEQGSDITLETIQYGKGGKRMCLSVFCRVLRGSDGAVRSHFLSYLDVTRRVEAEATASRRSDQLEKLVKDLLAERGRFSEANERYRLIVEGARDYAIFTTDLTGRITDWYKGAEAVFGWSRDEALDMLADITFTPEDREAGVPQHEQDIARAYGSAPNVRWHMRKDGSRAFIEGHTALLADVDGAPRGFLKIGQDMTERRAIAHREKTLLLELQHRVRNILATIRAMVGRSAKSTENKEEYREKLEGRIDAFARTQAQLTRTAGVGIELSQLIEDEINAHFPEPGQITVRGPGVVLSPKAAEVIALAVHELATNAAKYGALAVPTGRLDVNWSIAREGEDPWLYLVWRESGVNVQPASRRGFGTELICRRVPYELKGRGSVNIDSHGAQAIIEFPLRPGESILQTDATKQLGEEAWSK